MKKFTRSDLKNNLIVEKTLI